MTVTPVTTVTTVTSIECALQATTEAWAAKNQRHSTRKGGAMSSLSSHDLHNISTAISGQNALSILLLPDPPQTRCDPAWTKFSNAGVSPMSFPSSHY